MTSIADTAPAPASRSLWRPTAAVALAGIVGVLSLLLQPLPEALLAAHPELAALPPLALRGLLLINPLVLLLPAALAGAALAHRVGLGSVLAGTVPAAGLARALARAAGLGLALGLAIAALDAALAPALGGAWQQHLAASMPSASSVAVGILYGGLAEEVMLRWGLMSLIAWTIARLAGGAGDRAMGIAIVLAALAFGAAHLPALAAQVALSPGLVARTLLLNGIAGLLYGWLFWRRHLEAAMAAHAATHVGLAAARWAGV